MAAILGTLVIGLIVGAIAKFLMPGRDPGGCLITILLGIAGAFVAGFLGRAVGWYEPGQPAGRGLSPRSSARCYFCWCIG